MSASLLVVDASVVVSLLIDSSERGERVAARMADTQLHAPDHLPVETANVIRRRRNAGLLSEAEARLAVDGFWTLAVQLWPFEVVATRAWELGNNVSSYDAGYAALAERLDAPLATADRRLSRAPGLSCRIELFD